MIEETASLNTFVAVSTTPHGIFTIPLKLVNGVKFVKILLEFIVKTLA
ncbi:MAG: hypothetical protein FWE13_02780 [Firmicutes bacterium]|nr:hypothetical protein [Bacillota bacterium]